MGFIVDVLACVPSTLVTPLLLEVIISGSSRMSVEKMDFL
jgi:hypothetical protein